MQARLAQVIALLTVAAAVYWTVAFFYAAPRRDLDDRASALVDQLAELSRRGTDAKRALETPVSQVQMNLVTTADPAEAGATLQEQTRDAVAQVGGVTNSSQSANVDLGGGYTKLSVLLRARFDEGGLLAFLRRRESSRPAVYFESLEVHQQPLPGETRTLDVTATLSQVSVHAP
jgi:hypothetical protein